MCILLLLQFLFLHLRCFLKGFIGQRYFDMQIIRTRMEGARKAGKAERQTVFELNNWITVNVVLKELTKKH